MTYALDAELLRDVEPHASLIHTRHVRSLDFAAFEWLATYVQSRQQAFERVVKCQALVRPDGFVGAAVAGFYQVLSPSYPVRVFTDEPAALAWMGVGGAVATLAELDGLHRTATASSPRLHQLRSYVASHLATANLRAAARALGVSGRTLQRSLNEAGTTFHAVLHEVQIETSKALMFDTNYDLKRIALEVGCASPPSISANCSQRHGRSANAVSRTLRRSDLPAPTPFGPEQRVPTAHAPRLASGLVSAYVKAPGRRGDAMAAAERVCAHAAARRRARPFAAVPP